MGKMMGAAEFKTHCLRILDEVERTGETVTITKRGHPVAEIRPLEKRCHRILLRLHEEPEIPL